MSILRATFTRSIIQVLLRVCGGDQYSDSCSILIGLANDELFNALELALDSSHCWTVLANFCETVIRRKELVEHERQSLKRRRAFLTSASSDTKIDVQTTKIDVHSWSTFPPSYS